LPDRKQLHLALDHVGLAVRDLDRARAAYQRLGFTLSPRSMHSGNIEPGGPVIPWGSGNHCAMFRRGYFEVLGLVDQDMPSNVKAMLEKYEGLHIVALTCASADEAYLALKSANVSAAAPISLERDAAFGPNNESIRRARFRNVYLDSGAYPEARFIVIEHLTHDVVWQRHLLDHPNGAEALASVYFCVPDVARTRERFAALLGPDHGDAGDTCFSLHPGKFWVLSEAEIRERIPVLRSGPLNRVAAAAIAVSSLDALRSFFGRQGVAYTEAPSLDSRASIWVAPGEAHKTALAFFESEQNEETQG
jgi:catechol 2,3-dioxygenase-like lactoylglutathione lyase family enzyme